MVLCYWFSVVGNLGGVGMTIKIRIELVENPEEFHAQSHGATLDEAIESLQELQDWKSMEVTLKHFKYGEPLIKEFKETGFYCDR